MANAGPGANPLDFANHSQVAFPDARPRQGCIANLVRFVTQGTRFALPSALPPLPKLPENPLPPRRGGRSGAGGEVGEEGPGFGLMLAGGLMGGLGFMLAATGLSGVKRGRQDGRLEVVAAQPTSS